MSSSSYSSKLRDARWQRKRLEIMQRDEFTCKSCGASDKDEGTTLNVHHAYYEKNKNPWEYPEESLTTMCEECHEARHFMNRCVTIALAKIDISYAQRIAGMIARESANLELLARIEASGVSSIAINNLLRFALKNAGAS